MYNSRNSCQFIGNIGKLDKSYTQNGTPRLRISLATEGREKRGDEWEKVTQWVNLTAWGRIAERIDEYMPVGTTIVVNTSYRTYSTEGDDGNKRYYHDFTVNTVDVVRWKPRDGYQDSNGDGDLEDDEYPF